MIIEITMLAIAYLLFGYLNARLVQKYDTNLALYSRDTIIGYLATIMILWPVFLVLYTLLGLLATLNWFFGWIFDVKQGNDLHNY